MKTLKYGEKNTAVCQKRYAGHLNTIDGSTPAVHHGLQVGLQSVPSLGLLSAVSMSSSLLLLSSDESVLASSKAGIGAWACTFKANVRLEVTAGDPMTLDCQSRNSVLKLSPHEKIPGGAKLLTGDPSVRLSNAFSPTVMGDIGAGNPRRARSKGGIVGEVSLKCGGVLGPAVPIVVSGEALDWEPNG